MQVCNTTLTFHTFQTHAGISGFWCSTGGARIRAQRQRQLRFRQCFFVPQKWASAKLQIPGPSNAFKLNDIGSYTHKISSLKKQLIEFSFNQYRHIYSKIVGTFTFNGPKKLCQTFQGNKAPHQPNPWNENQKKNMFSERIRDPKNRKVEPRCMVSQKSKRQLSLRSQSWGEKICIYTLLTKSLYVCGYLNSISSSASQTSPYHPPSTPKPHWSNHGGK